MRSLWKLIKHNQSLVIGLALSLGVVVWAYGCQTTAVSILHPPTRVSREELHLEVDTFLAQAKLRFEAMDKEDMVKSTIFNASIEFLRGSTVNPVGVAITLGNIIGLGAIIDNRRKDGIIKTYKTVDP